MTFGNVERSGAMALGPAPALRPNRPMSRPRPLGVVFVAEVLAFTASGCSAVGEGPQPSKACGGYHLMVLNRAPVQVEIRFNGSLMTTLQTDISADIPQWGSTTPLMPWDVEISRATDHVVLLRLHLTDDGSDGRSIEVVDSPAASPVLTAYECGPGAG